MKILSLCLSALVLMNLGGCAWETYQTQSGQTRLRQTYPTGTPIYYQNGTYSRDPYYNQYRPIQRAILPQDAPDEKGIHWSGREDASAPESQP